MGTGSPFLGLSSWWLRLVGHKGDPILLGARDEDQGLHSR